MKAESIGKITEKPAVAVISDRPGHAQRDLLAALLRGIELLLDRFELAEHLRQRRPVSTCSGEERPATLPA
jgi:hypothetical protein